MCLNGDFGYLIFEFDDPLLLTADQVPQGLDFFQNLIQLDFRFLQGGGQTISCIAEAKTIRDPQDGGQQPQSHYYLFLKSTACTRTILIP